MRYRLPHWIEAVAWLSFILAGYWASQQLNRGGRVELITLPDSTTAATEAGAAE